MQDVLSKHDLMQRLNNRTAPPDELDPYYSRHDDELLRDGNPLGALTLILIGMVMGMFFLFGVRHCDKQPDIQIKCIACHNIKTRPPEQLLTYKSYRLFHSKLIREI